MKQFSSFLTEQRGPSYKDLADGDVLVDAKGVKHEYSHTVRGIGRMVVHMRDGSTVATERDGTLDGFKKTGQNNAK